MPTLIGTSLGGSSAAERSAFLPQSRPEQTGPLAVPWRLAPPQMRGLDIGPGMVEGGAKALIGARETEPGMPWTVRGAQAVANVRVLLFSDHWATYDLAA